MANPAGGVGRQLFSAQVSDAISMYRQNKGFLADQTRSVQSACADWDIMTDNLSKKQYDHMKPDLLRSTMNAEVDRYRNFRKAREQANLVFDFLGRIIAGVTRHQISEEDLQTLAQSGFPIKWARQNTQLRADILPHLQSLATRVETLKAKIEGQIKPTAHSLNNALYHFYCKLGLWTGGLAAKNAIGFKAYMDDAIAVREAELASAPAPFALAAAPAEEAAAVNLEEVEVDTSQQEVGKLQALLAELQEMTGHIALDGSDAAPPADEAVVLAPPPAAIVPAAAPMAAFAAPAEPAAAPAAPAAAPAAPAAAPAAPAAAPAAPAAAPAAPAAAPAAPAAAPAAPAPAATDDSDDEDAVPTSVAALPASDRSASAPAAASSSKPAPLVAPLEVAVSAAPSDAPAAPSPALPSASPRQAAAVSLATSTPVVLNVLPPEDGKEDFPALPTRSGVQAGPRRGPLPSQMYASRSPAVSAAALRGGHGGGNKKNK